MGDMIAYFPFVFGLLGFLFAMYFSVQESKDKSVALEVERFKQMMAAANKSDSEVNQALLESLLLQQEKKERTAAWTNRAVGFFLGIVSSDMKF